MVHKELLSQTNTNTGENILDLSKKAPVMLIFLRHLGCVFCQEALGEIRKIMNKGNIGGKKIVFVHMAELSIAERYFDDFKINVDYHVSDPECKLYESFGLIKTTTRELFSFQVMLRTAENMVMKGHFPSRSRIGDGFQMPGVFVIDDGKIVDSYIHKRISDRPDYLKMLNKIEK